MKTIIKLFIYGSLIALLIYLYNIDFLILKNIEFNYSILILSFVFLFAGFVFSAVSWKKALKLHGVQVSTIKAIFSHGFPVFTKYIPGRIWTIVGRAALVQTKDHSLKFLSFVSLKEQLIYLCLGFLISIYPILRTEKIRDYSVVIISITLVMFLLLFSKLLQKRFEVIWNKIFKKNIHIPTISIKEFFTLSWYILFYWILWAVGFYLLLLSVFNDVPLFYSFAFPLSVSLGLISIIFPGGIGVREGVITLFLVSNGIRPELAVSFSVICRVWFLIGEVFIFGLALLNREKNGR